MAELKTKIKLYLEDNSKTWDEEKVIIQDNMIKGVSSPYIKTWTYDIAKPDDSKIAEYETAGNAAEANAVIDATRQTQYLSWQQQMEMIYKDQKNGTTTFKNHCDKVRSDNPKE